MNESAKGRLVEMIGQYNLKRHELVGLKLKILKLSGSLGLTDHVMKQMEWM